MTSKTEREAEVTTCCLGDTKGHITPEKGTFLCTFQRTSIENAGEKKDLIERLSSFGK